jgi:hypothetical protein
LLTRTRYYVGMAPRFNFMVFVAAASSIALAARAPAQSVSPIAGVWTLNKTASDAPREIGFNVSWLPPESGAGQDSGSARGGGRGRRGSSGGGGGGARGGGAFSAPRESYEDSQRVQLLTAEARNPPARLMIVDTPAAVTITNDLGQSRVVHPDGKQDSIEFQGVLFLVTTRRDGDKLLVSYQVSKDREVRYAYARSATSPQLQVDVQFLERGSGDKAMFVYDSGVATDRATSAAATPRSSSAPAVPAQPNRETFDERPGAELRGIKTLGILVEDLSSTATACGLNHDALEAAVSKRLTDAGFIVRRNSDDDTYVYVNVITNSVGTGICVSRYDMFLYTHGTAKLSYRDQPVLVQVSLVHRGGIGSSAPASHAAAVARGLENYTDLMVTQIRDANK